jgi:hypothetical protein
LPHGAPVVEFPGHVVLDVPTVPDDDDDVAGPEDEFVDVDVVVFVFVFVFVVVVVDELDDSVEVSPGSTSTFGPQQTSTATAATTHRFTRSG